MYVDWVSGYRMLIWSEERVIERGEFVFGKEDGRSVEWLGGCF